MVTVYNLINEKKAYHQCQMLIYVIFFLWIIREIGKTSDIACKPLFWHIIIAMILSNNPIGSLLT